MHTIFQLNPKIVRILLKNEIFSHCSTCALRLDKKNVKTKNKEHIKLHRFY